MAKRPGQNVGIRYSEAFKMAVVRELEQEDLPCEHLRRKYGIKCGSTVQSWVRKYGNGSRGVRIRVEKPEEINELKRLRARVRQLESALADANIEAALERAFLELACERAGLDVEEFKKKRLGSCPQNTREAWAVPRLRGQCQLGMPVVGDDAAELLCAAQRAATAGGGR
jgi:transposase-like protein